MNMNIYEAFRDKERKKDLMIPNHHQRSNIIFEMIFIFMFTSTDCCLIIERGSQRETTVNKLCVFVLLLDAEIK